MTVYKDLNQESSNTMTNHMMWSNTRLTNITTEVMRVAFVMKIIFHNLP